VTNYISVDYMKVVNCREGRFIWIYRIQIQMSPCETQYWDKAVIIRFRPNTLHLSFIWSYYVQCL